MPTESFNPSRLHDDIKYFLSINIVSLWYHMFVFYILYLKSTPVYYKCIITEVLCYFISGYGGSINSDF